MKSKKRIALITGASGGIGKEFGERIIALSLDLSKQESMIEIGGLLKKEQPDVAYLINNAGIGEALGSYRELTVEKSCQTIQLNCSAVVSLCTVYVKYMQLLSKIFPHSAVMRTWVKSISKYL